MKAYRLDDFTSRSDLRLRDEDVPRPQQGEVPFTFTLFP